MTEQRMRFTEEEFYARCWADDGIGACTEKGVGPLGLCPRHRELLIEASR